MISMPVPKSPIPLIQRGLRTACILLGLALASACNSQTTSGPADNEQVSPSDSKFREYNLTLYGYNYTDFEIGSYEVNGQGGGNLEVSDGSEGGGGSVCCVTVYSPMTQPQPVTIKWNPTGDKWCEQTVLLQPPLPTNPKNFEVHFYQDGHIEVAVSSSQSTRLSSPSRLVLQRKHGNSRHQDEHKNVDNSSRFARCQNGYF